MNTSTHCLAIAAPKEKAFALLSDIENLPKWATDFCRALKRRADGRYTIVTPMGEMAFRIDGDAKSGIIDMHGGPSEDQMSHWPARVIGLPDGGSLFMLTAIQYPGVGDEQFAADCRALEEEFPNILALVEGEPAARHAA